MKRFLCGILAFFLVLFTGCGDNPGGGTPAGNAPVHVPGARAGEPYKPSLTLPVDVTEPLNPFLLGSRLNMNLAALLYDGLFALDEKFQPVPALCESFVVSDRGDTYTLTLREAYFSDGAPLTAADVVYSVRRYQQLSTIYSEKAANIKSIAAQGDRTVVLTLIRPNGGLPALLTMPIVRNGGGAEDVPAGTGRYRVDTGEDRLLLLPNELWYGGNTTSYQEIELYPINSADQLLYGMTAGLLSVVETEKLSSAALTFRGNFDTFSFPTLSLHFLGVRCGATPFHDPAVRQALSLLIDREAFVRESYGGFADPAVWPVHPYSPLSPDPQPTRADADAAEALFAEAGLSDTDGDGLLDYASGRRRVPVSAAILVNRDSEAKREAAEQIAGILRSHGIDAAVEAVSFEDFTARLAAGNFTLYLGEALVPPDFDFSAWLDREGALNYGGWRPSLTFPAAPAQEGGASGQEGAAPQQESAASAQVNLPALMEAARAASGEQRAAAYKVFCEGFLAESPVIPLCFERNLLLFSGGRPRGLVAAGQDIYYNLHLWDVG